MHYIQQGATYPTLNSMHSVGLVDDYLAIIFQNSRCKTGTNLNSFSQSRTSCLEAFGATTNCSNLLPSCKTSHLFILLPISELLDTLDILKTEFTMDLCKYNRSNIWNCFEGTQRQVSYAPYFENTVVLR
jgi:hypothetical protein